LGREQTLPGIEGGRMYLNRKKAKRTAKKKGEKKGIRNHLLGKVRGFLYEGKGQVRGWLKRANPGPLTER